MKTFLTGIVLIYLLAILKVNTVQHNQRDGEWGILLTINDAQSPNLYWMRPDGSYIERVFHFDNLSANGLTRPRGVLSPDGQHLTVTFSSNTSPYHRFSLFNLQTSSLSQLTRETAVSKSFYWSPDSQQMAYLSDIWGGKLYMIDLESAQEKLIATSDQLKDTSGTSYFMSLDWSPDNQTLAVSYLHEDRLASVGDLTIVLINADGTNMHRLLNPGHWSLAPAWGDKDTIYYVCQAPAGRLVSLCAVDVPRRLTVHIHDFTPFLPEKGYIKTLDVAPDGRILLSFGDISGNDLIYIFDLHNRDLLNLSEAAGLRGSQPIWFYHHIKSQA